MRFRSVNSGALALALLVLTGPTALTAERAPIYAGLHGELLLDNSRLRVEKFVIAPGQSTGRHSYPSDQLLVFIKGGVLQSLTTGRATLWRDGRVAWHNATASADAGSRNTGTAALVIVCVSLKPIALASPPATADEGSADAHLNYPNIPGEDLLENARVIVQRFTIGPGQWEGVHAHRPNMLYIHVKGGQWATRSKSEPEHPYPQSSPDGEVGWMRTVDISEGHESGNFGKENIDLIWLTLKG